MSSTFVVGATTVTFTAQQDGFSETFDGTLALRQLQVPILLGATGDWATLLGLISWQVTPRVVPGASSPSVDIAGGAGLGILTIDHNADSPFIAVLTGLERGSTYPGGGKLCTGTFLAW